jgi:anti-sigma factor RsiW
VNPCAESDRLQEYLDGELDDAAEAQMSDHLASCAECAFQLALYQRVFATLDATPMLEPAPALTARILAKVLPSEIRRRWLRAFGWGYSVAAAASVVAAVGLLGSPIPRTALGLLGIEASQRLAQATMFVIDSLALAMVHLAGGWTLLQDVALRLSPLFRVLSTLLARPGVDLTLALATVVSGFLLVWLRPRDLARKRARARREIEHAGLLA